MDDGTVMSVEAEYPHSPCIKRCRIDPETDVCTGCRRTAGEIARWTRMSRERRRRVLARIADGSGPSAYPGQKPGRSD